MSKTTPTQRSLAKLRSDSWTAFVVEKWVTVPGMPGGGIRRDLGGFADVLAWRPHTSIVRDDINGIWLKGGGFLAVQACAGSGLAAHRKKLLAEPNLRSWLESGGRCAIWAWRRISYVKKDGKKGRRKDWACLEEELTLDQFPTPPPPSTAPPSGTCAATPAAG